jgi:hypothetical protein
MREDLGFMRKTGSMQGRRGHVCEKNASRTEE